MKEVWCEKGGREKREEREERGRKSGRGRKVKEEL